MGRVGGGVSSPAVPLQGEELRRVLLQQLEYYFSKDNLSSDKYLCELTCGEKLRRGIGGGGHVQVCEGPGGLLLFGLFTACVYLLVLSTRHLHYSKL